jgi:POT family proton-dependent oligopeptide transporter
MALVHLTGILPLTPVLLVNAAGVVLLVIVAGLFAWMLLGGDWTPVERKRLGAILVLFVAASLFWAAYEQAGSSLSLFAERSSNNVILHFNFPASWYQSLNSLFIVALAPLLAWLWIRLGNRQPSSPVKFALGLLFVGLGFVVLVFGALLSAHGARVSPLFLVATYLLHTIGELCISPVGLSAITKLAPARVGSFMMGVWFISISIGDYLGARLTSFYGALPVPILFGIAATTSILAGLALFLIARPVTRLMGGVR